ncbi:hypothetical protein VSS74_23835 [Conexibacter stalactiti]|uniref:Uncharacterized protein n=1 Tax=Conexibacter stalactiti TaxID=1940611 RepID=A0ABU4HVP9_9ACTN|nr:hypothetical protein [Conexibacter stalactiti]MDW5597400.1 hypothetical protein [Conexibacter stalactiti]MEC5038042.1 hypothetical protein [Conexibacter stalactiti]
MFTRWIHALLVGILATVAMGAAVSSATATRLSISPTSASASGVLSLGFSGITTTCNITLAILTPNSIAKTVGTPIGSILLTGVGRTILSGCSAAFRTVTVLNGVVLSYTSFSGTLPNISSITTDVRTNGPGFLILYAAGPACLYNRFGLRVVLNRNVATGSITSLTISTPGTLATIVLNPPGLNCFTGLKLAGILTVQAPQPRVTLI